MWGSELLSDFMDECVFMDRTTGPDGYGGVRTFWSEGAPFDAVIVKSNDTDILASGAATNTTYYGVKTSKDVPLEYRSVFKRLRDGKTFRVTADQGMHTPDMSRMNMQQFPIEEWEIPSE